MSLMPKYRYRFRPEFDGIDSYLIRGIQLPRHTIHVNGYLAPLKMAKMSVFCPEAGQTESMIQSLIEKQESTSLSDCIISWVGATGKIMSKYHLVRPSVVFFEWSPMDHTSEEHLIIDVYFNYEKIEFTQE